MATAQLSQPALTTRAPRRSSRTRGQAMWGYLLIAPMMTGFAIFFLFALLVSLGLSMTNWEVLTAPQWVGVSNYVKLPHDTEFLTALRNTAMLAIPNVTLRLLFSLCIALALNSRIRFRAFYRTIFFMPVLTMPVATATIWKWLFDPKFGPINAQLGGFGLPQPEWLNHPETAVIAVVIVLLWSGVGYDMVIYLAGLQNIPREYYEAAQIDGASAFRHSVDLTRLLLPPRTFLLVVIVIIGVVHDVDLVLVMARVGN